MALDPITAVAGLVDTVVSRIWPDATEEEKGKLAQFSAEVSLVLGQQKINEEEAKHAKVFVAGWRPYVGWSCATALNWHFFIGPIIAYITDKPLPPFDLSALIQILMGLLGLTVVSRTYEKLKGVQERH